MALSSPASNITAYLDATLSKEDGEAIHSIIAPSGLPATVTNAPHDRVVPLLLRDVATHTQLRQRMHLRAFSDSLDDFIAFDDTTDEEWEMLLVMLFCLMKRRGGLTPMQEKYNNDVSDICFDLICRLLSPTQNETKFHCALSALGRMMETLKCTAERFFERGENAPEPNDEAIALPDDGIDGDRAAEPADLPNLVAAATAPSTALPAVAGAPGFAAHPFFYTVDSVNEAHRVDFCEADFQQTVAWFEACEIDPANTAVRMVYRGMQAQPRIGSKFCSVGVMCEFQACYPHGGCSLFELLRFLFRYVPDRVLLRRCNGVVIRDDVTVASVPDPSSAGFVAPIPVQISNELRVLQRTVDVGCTAETVKLLRRWWGFIAFHVEDGQLASYCTAGAIEAANGGALGDWVVDGRAIVAAKGNQDIITFADVVKQLFPVASGTTVRTAIAAANADYENRLDAWLKAKAADNAAFEVQLRNHIESPPSPSKTPLSAPQSAPDQVPGSPVQNVLTAEMVATIASLHTALRTEYLSRTTAALRIAVLTNEQQRMRAHHEEVLRNHRQYHEAMDRKNVCPIAGPAPPPPVAERFGFKISPAILQLDAFLPSDRGTRGRVRQLLECLDHSGVVAGYFLADPAQLHLFVPRSLTQPCRVFRDIAFCARRPPSNTFWEGNHVLHVKTSIPAHSDIKYRFLIEGYNFGLNCAINTVVVGYAARMLDRVDSLEAFGWPDSWDKRTIVHHAKGISSLKQYFTSDGFLAFRCEARSFSSVGFGVSAWVVCHDFGAGFPVNASIVHQSDPL